MNIELTPRAKVIGTAFLLFQLLFAANNYGPQRIPVLSFVFDEPFVTPAVVTAPPGQSAVQYVDVAEEAGLDDFQRASFNDDDPNYLEVMGGGLAVGDYDGDGRDDLFIGSLPAFGQEGAASPSTLYRQDPDGTFVNVTRDVGLDRLQAHAQGAIFFDADADGDRDLYIAAYGGGQLMRNDEGFFRDVTVDAGLDLNGRCGDLPCFGSAPSVSDFDRDGDLDLLVVNNVAFDLEDPAQRGERNLFPAFFAPQQSMLFRNDSGAEGTADVRFTNVTDASGLDNLNGKGLSAVWLDVNEDGWPDVYVSNDLSRNTLYLNDGDGTFTEFAAGAGVDEIKSSMGVAAGDVDHDGRIDLAVTNLKGSRVSLFRNTGDLEFEYMTDRNGLAVSGRASGWGVLLQDVDGDGHADLVAGGGPVWEREPRDTEHLLFRGDGSGGFKDVTPSSGALDHGCVSRGMAAMDIERSDGPAIVVNCVDGASPQLLRIPESSERRWLRLRLEGTASNLDGIGARVTLVRTDGLRIVDEVRGGGSYQSAGTRTLFFGLSDADVAELTVSWPSGHVDVHHDVPADASVVIREGEGWTHGRPKPGR